MEERKRKEADNFAEGTVSLVQVIHKLTLVIIASSTTTRNFILGMIRFQKEDTPVEEDRILVLSFTKERDFVSHSLKCRPGKESLVFLIHSTVQKWESKQRCR